MSEKQPQPYSPIAKALLGAALGMWFVVLGYAIGSDTDELPLWAFSAPILWLACLLVQLGVVIERRRVEKQTKVGHVHSVTNAKPEPDR